MAITIDGPTKRIILDSANVSAAEIWSAWVDWHPANSQWPLAFQLVGGIALGGGLFIPPYFFLLSGWRVRPLEASHILTVTGYLFVEGGGNDGQPDGWSDQRRPQSVQAPQRDPQAKALCCK